MRSTLASLRHRQRLPRILQRPRVATGLGKPEVRQIVEDDDLVTEQVRIVANQRQCFFQRRALLCALPGERICVAEIQLDAGALSQITDVLGHPEGIVAKVDGPLWITTIRVE